MKTLKVLSALLCYPEPALVEALPELEAILASERVLPAENRVALRRLVRELGGTDLMTMQQRYVNLFDRGRALSLHIFEHVHGESRARGQAMVDLMAHYRACGFEVSVHELPDYIPLVLEFLAQRPREEAMRMLGDAMPVLTLIGARLARRGSPYAAVFWALEALAGSPEGAGAIRRQAGEEGPDDTLVRMDQIWEEEAVRFTPPAGGCPSSSNGTPVRWVGRGPKNDSSRP